MFVRGVALFTALVGATVAINHDGRGTVYNQQGAYGSCGKKHSDNDNIVALSNYWMKDQSPSQYCGRKIFARNTGSDDGVGGAGNSVTVTVADTCPGCGENDLDFSIGAWNTLTNNAVPAEFDVEWHFCNVDGIC